MSDGRGGPAPNFGPGPAYPRLVTIGGVVWIIFGGLLLLYSLMMLWLRGDWIPYPRLGESENVWWGITSAGLGAIFLTQGIGGVRGTVVGTLGTGLLSIVFGLLFLWAWATVTQEGRLLPAGVLALVGVGLLGAGLLALGGRSDFNRWHKAQRLRANREERRAEQLAAADVGRHHGSS